MNEPKTRRLRRAQQDELLPANTLSAMFHGFELAAYRGVLSAVPDHVGALMALGHMYTKLGAHKDALEIDRHLSRLCPDDPICRYNYACSLSNLGLVEESLAELEASIKLGYRDFAYMKQDPDLENARKDPRFKRLTDAWKRQRV